LPSNQISTLSGDAEKLLFRSVDAPNPIIDIGSATLFMPDTSEIADESGLGGNRHYMDINWADPEEIVESINFENRFLELVAEGVHYEDVIENFVEDDGVFFGLDPGVAAAALTFCAVGAITYSSCNGGLLGGSHRESHPLIALYAPSDSVLTQISQLCSQSGLGLKAAPGRTEIIAYASHLHPFRRLSLLFLHQN